MLTSIIRTVVPWLVALIGPWVLRTLGVSEADLSAVLTVLLGAGYYVLARLLEQVWPAAGLLLGRRGAPVYDPPGRHEADDGRSSLLLPLVMAAAVLAALAFVAIAIASASPADARPRPAEHVAINDARVCSSTLTVAFSLELLHRHGVWEFLEDDGSARVELHHVGAAAGPGGHWEAYPAASGGEGRLRVAVGGLPYWDAARVVHDGWTSSARLPQECAA